jgi:hypothetical protein
MYRTARVRISTEFEANECVHLDGWAGVCLGGVGVKPYMNSQVKGLPWFSV